MATHIKISREAVRHYLHQQWTTMVNNLGNLEAESDTNKEKARDNFVAFEEALSFPYNQKLAFFPADIGNVEGTGRAMGEFGAGSLVPSLEDPSHEELAAQQSAMLASLYARQEFIRAAARMPMTLFIGPSSERSTNQKFLKEGTLLTAEKFSRVVFSGITTKKGSVAAEYVAVAELSRTYPQTAVARLWWTSDDPGTKNQTQVIKDMKARWLEIVGKKGTKNTKRILFQRGKHSYDGIPLFTLGLEAEVALEEIKENNLPLYIRFTPSSADMWANVIAQTASDKHGDMNLLEEKDKKGKEVKLWGTQGSKDDMDGWQWMASMLALRRIPYIVKNEDTKDANRDGLPHALTQFEAGTVKDMMGAIIIARRQKGNPKAPKKSSSSSSSNSNFSGNQKQRVIFTETAKWW